MKKFLFAILATHLFVPTAFSQQQEKIDILKYAISSDGIKDTLVFFNLGRNVYTQDVTEGYERLGLTPDPLLQEKFNSANRVFAETHPNVSFWIDDKGTMLYGKWFSPPFKTVVDTIHQDDIWISSWWFGGVPIR
jgi:hypothetical protein